MKSVLSEVIASDPCVSPARRVGSESDLDCFGVIWVSSASDSPARAVRLKQKLSSETTQEVFC